MNSFIQDVVGRKGFVLQKDISNGVHFKVYSAKKDCDECVLKVPNVFSYGSGFIDFASKINHVERESFVLENLGGFYGVPNVVDVFNLPVNLPGFSGACAFSKLLAVEKVPGLFWGDRFRSEYLSLEETHSLVSLGHSAGFANFDLKRENFVIDDFVPRLTDFGSWKYFENKNSFLFKILKDKDLYDLDGLL